MRKHLFWDAARAGASIKAVPCTHRIWAPTGCWFSKQKLTSQMLMNSRGKQNEQACSWTWEQGDSIWDIVPTSTTLLLWPGEASPGLSQGLQSSWGRFTWQSLLESMGQLMCHPPQDQLWAGIFSATTVLMKRSWGQRSVPLEEGVCHNNLCWADTTGFYICFCHRFCDFP